MRPTWECFKWSVSIDIHQMCTPRWSQHPRVWSDYHVMLHKSLHVMDCFHIKKAVLLLLKMVVQYSNTGYPPFTISLHVHVHILVATLHIFIPILVMDGRKLTEMAAGRSNSWKGLFQLCGVPILQYYRSVIFSHAYFIFLLQLVTFFHAERRRQRLLHA